MSSPALRDSRLPDWAWVTLPVLVGAWLRLRGIGDPDAFVDEGANILTALDPRVRLAFEPLAQGRPWLIHLYRPAGWFSTDVLLAARLLTAGAGLATLAALGWTLHLLAGRAAALSGLWLWAVMPLAVFHERLALADPFVTALLAWAMALTAAGSRAERKGNGLWYVVAGGFLGIAFLLKISAALALPWLGIVYLAIQHHLRQPLFDRRLGFLVLGTMAPVLTLGSNLRHLGSGLERYGALAPLASADFLVAGYGRLQAWIAWYAGYGGWPLGLLLLAALGLAGSQRHRLALTCASGWIVTVLITSLCYQNSYARYLLPDQVPLMLFLGLTAGAGLTTVRLRPVAWALLVSALAAWGHASWTISPKPEQAAVPAAEIAQYYTGPWSGRGLREVRQFLTDYADRNKVSCLVLTHRFLRPGCYGLLLAERGDPRIGVVPFTLYEPAELAATLPSLRQATAGRNVAFFLLYEGSLYPAPAWLDQPNSAAHRVQQVPRGAGESFSLYQFRP
jgi:Dolichyl-phosphate-mannose-protein mannosyltransferase